MTTVTAVHGCPRCELRFAQPVELFDHLERDHDVATAPLPAPAGRVVLAVDPSHADPGPALAVSTTLAAQLGAALEIVAAAAPGLGPEVTRARLQGLAGECRHRGPSWLSWHDLGAGPPAPAVVQCARDRHPAWLCLASRSRTAVGEKVFGSVAGQIIAEAEVPVVVVGPRAEAPVRYDRVVACVDRSVAGPRVLAAAADLADRLDAGLVVAEVSVPDVGGDPIADDRHLHALVRHLDRDVTTIVLAGSRTWIPLLDFVKDDPGTILVTGRRPPTAPGRFVFGSVAVNLARRAHGPVMIVPNPPEET